MKGRCKSPSPEKSYTFDLVYMQYRTKYQERLPSCCREVTVLESGGSWRAPNSPEVLECQREITCCAGKPVRDVHGVLLHDVWYTLLIH